MFPLIEEIVKYLEQSSYQENVYIITRYRLRYFGQTHHTWAKELSKIRYLLNFLNVFERYVLFSSTGRRTPRWLQK